MPQLGAIGFVALLTPPKLLYVSGTYTPNNLSTSFYFLSFYQPAGPGFTLSPLAADCNHRDIVKTMLL